MTTTNPETVARYKCLNCNTERAYTRTSKSKAPIWASKHCYKCHTTSKHLLLHEISAEEAERRIAGGI